MQQGNDSYRLIVRRGPQPNQIYELNEETVNLGRDITNNIVINDREVSRHHLRFTRGPDGITMEDLGSTNGTFINGRRLTGATLLKNGDMIGLGETVTLGYEVLRGGMGGMIAPAAASPSASPYQPPAPAPVPPAPQVPPASPYQPPAVAAPQPDPYQAPPQYVPPSAQPSPSGYAAPQPQPAYQGQPTDPYQQQQAYPAPDPYQSYSPPPPPGSGYDQHDPFGMREEETSNTGRILLIGCAVVMVMCCCCTLVGFVAIDVLCLYDRVPLLPNILEALGVAIECPAP